jgi:hypothetical protein
MNRNWGSLGLRILPALLAALAVSHPAFAREPICPVPGAPELDPRLAIEGLAMAGVAAGLIWERVRRRR